MKDSFSRSYLPSVSPLLYPRLMGSFMFWFFFPSLFYLCLFSSLIAFWTSLFKKILEFHSFYNSISDTMKVRVLLKITSVNVCGLWYWYHQMQDYKKPRFFHRIALSFFNFSPLFQSHFLTWVGKHALKTLSSWRVVLKGICCPQEYCHKAKSFHWNGSCHTEFERKSTLGFKCM